MLALESIAEALGRGGDPVHLCLIGSAACLFGGMEGRTSRDLDVWKPASEYDLLDLKRAVESAGLAFDPKTVLEPDQPYLQLIEPGLTQVGEFTPVRMEKMGRLILSRPPVENLIAAKLIRADARDIGDIQFLYQLHQPDPERIRGIVDSFPPAARNRAVDNLVYLEILQ